MTTDTSEAIPSLESLQDIVGQCARKFCYDHQLNKSIDREDLIQAANLRLTVALPKYRPEGLSVLAFVWRRATFAMSEWLRDQDHLSRAHRRRVGPDAHDLILRPYDYDYVCPRPGPLELLEGGVWDDCRPIRLAKLQWRERVILALLALEGFTYADVAKTFGRSKPVVTRWINTIAYKLRGRRCQLFNGCRRR